MVLKDPSWTRVSLLANLVFFYFLTACSSSPPVSVDVSILWEDSLPAGLIVPRNRVPSLTRDAVEHRLQIHLLHDSLPDAILGEYIFSRDQVIFKPLIPLTSLLTYGVLFDGDTLDQIKIPFAGGEHPPEIVAVYPTQDTLPENLLKLYVRFSQPMLEAHPLDFVALLRNHSDTVHAAFLDLTPPLWDYTGTQLTLWFDPGRIKRDLQPNRKSGPPLSRGEHYQLVISDSWPSKNGSRLGRPYSKKFFTASRDSIRPDPHQWKLRVPAPQTIEPLKIELFESLDYVLLSESIHIMDNAGNRVAGKIRVGREEMELDFVPARQWGRGRYKISLQPRLEDLAGNNLNRLFEEDVTGPRTSETPAHTINFDVE